jgi:ABC-type lipoprotein release transport system permease subunit
MFIVAGRTREIAIRVAIGAGAGHVRWLVMREALWAATTGAVAGALAGRWLSGTIESLVYGVESGSWSTTLVAAAAAVTMMGLSAMLPARRALRLDPTAALRVE